ncbi:MAG: thiopeptide-type bacteriocin biosynthesis protein [Bacteroidales bacterium]|nr:thiopeptide-type bacteriocin biosynthesis protein [Bacteroidales bacterium]
MNKKPVKRSFIIGDEWVYYKFYCGARTADQLLTESIGPVADSLIESLIIDKWFFIWYNDPDPHLRVRFHLKSNEKINLLIRKVKETVNDFLKDKLIWKVQIDTYERELERYGDETIELAENIFFYDTILVINLLKKIEIDNASKFRWLISLKATDEFLNDFHYDLERKKQLMFTLKDEFAREFRMDRALKSQLDVKFRKERTSINSMLNGGFDGSHNYVMKQIGQRSHFTRTISQTLHNHFVQGGDNGRLDDFMCSQIHMHNNRLFRSRQRQHEMVIYDFLYRYYRSEIAKNKK